MATVTTLTDAATITPDFTAASWDQGQRRGVFAVTIAGNRTIANPVVASWDGLHMVLRVTQDSTGGRTLSWGSAFDFLSGGGLAAPVLLPQPGQCTEMIFGDAAGTGAWRLVVGARWIDPSTATTWPSWS